MIDALTQVDLAFVVDTTGSMGAFIGAARQHMIAMLRSLTDDAETPPDLRLAVVEYRDHPPQDHTFVARPHAFETNLARCQKVINSLKPDGGGVRWPGGRLRAARLAPARLPSGRARRRFSAARHRLRRRRLPQRLPMRTDHRACAGTARTEGHHPVRPRSDRHGTEELHAVGD